MTLLVEKARVPRNGSWNDAVPEAGAPMVERTIALVRMAGAFAWLSFLIAHMYLTTTGKHAPPI